jgi:hypothetical protein
VEGGTKVIRKIFIAGAITSLLLLATSCSSTDQTSTTNANNAATTTAGPDNSEIVTTNENGVRTETRTFRSNRRVSRVVVTTRDGSRTAKVYSASGEEREMKSGVETALNATGDAIADAVGFTKTAAVEVGDKTEDVYDKTKEGVKKVGEKTKDGAEKVADKTVDTTKKVADKTVDTSKKVADKTVDTSKKVADKSVDIGKTVVNKTKTGVKKTGKAIKKVIP